MTNGVLIHYLYWLNLNLRLFGAWDRENMVDRHVVVSDAKHFVPIEHFLSLEMSNTAEADLVLSFSFGEIAEKPRDICNKSVVIFPIEQIGDALVCFAADHQRMASAAFINKKGEHIEIYLKLIFVQMDIVACDEVWESVEIMTLKHFVFVKNGSKAMLFWKIGSFEEIKKCVAEASLVVVIDVDYCFLFR